MTNFKQYTTEELLKAKQLMLREDTPVVIRQMLYHKIDKELKRRSVNS